MIFEVLGWTTLLLLGGAPKSDNSRGTVETASAEVKMHLLIQSKVLPDGEGSTGEKQCRAVSPRFKRCCQVKVRTDRDVPAVRFVTSVEYSKGKRDSG